MNSTAVPHAYRTDVPTALSWSAVMFGTLIGRRGETLDAIQYSY